MIFDVEKQFGGPILALFNKVARLKVSKHQRQILKFSFEPKTEQKYFCISALAL